MPLSGFEIPATVIPMIVILGGTAQEIDVQIDSPQELVCAPTEDPKVEICYWKYLDEIRSP